MNPLVASPCPDESLLVALLEERLDEAERASAIAHAGTCPSCSRTLERLSAGWSLGGLCGQTDASPGADTLAIAGRVAERRPPGPAHGSAHAAVPRAAPTIPGLVDLELIGRGGMAVVYRGRDTALDRTVAVKVLASIGPLSDSARARAARESLMLARLNHPHVVTIHGTGETADGVPYLVMEWVAGQSLQQRIDAGPLDAREAARIVRDLARALGAVHALGIVHRDLKPDNILLAPSDGPTGVVAKLADFGLARPEDAPTNLTQADAIAGTPCFMAAEQTGLDPALGGVGPATDIHGLGGVLYAAVVGRPPYEGRTPGESMQRAARGEPTAVATLAARCPLDLRTIVMKCLRPDPVRRYRSAGDLADDLDRFLDGRPVLARPLSRVERLVKWTRRQPLAAAALAVAALASGLGVGATAYQLASLRRANVEITRSRDAAGDANAVARRSLARLTDAAVRRLLVRGTPLDEDDRSFLRMVRDEYLGWPLEPDPSTNLRFRADGLTQLAGLFFEINQYAEALTTQQALIATLEQLDASSGDGAGGSAQPSLERYAAMRMERLILGRVSGSAAVEEAARRALAMLEAAPADDIPHRIEMAAVLLELGWHLGSLGRQAEANPLLDKAVDLMESIRLAAPDDREAMRLEVAALYNAGLSHANAGHVERQTALSQKLVESTSATLARTSDVPIDVPKGLCLGLTLLANREAEQGRWPEAVALMERRLAVCQEWMTRDPGEPVMREQAIDAWLQLADGYGQTEQPDRQAEALAAAVGLAEAAVAREPAIFDHSRMSFRTLRHSAGVVGSRDPAAAIGMLERGVRLLEPWFDIEGRRDEVGNLLAEAHMALSQLAAAGGDRAKAVSHLEKAEAVVSPDFRDRVATMLAVARKAVAADSPEGGLHRPDGESP